MKWTPNRVIALAAVGLIAWGASSATGDERGPTAPPQVAAETRGDATGSGPVAATTHPAATSLDPQTNTAPAPRSPSSAGTSAARAGATGKAAAVLATLPVKGRAPMTGYAREQFGQAWSDDVTVAFGHNGCDTRNDVLRRDLRNTTLKAGTNGCLVLTGSFTEPYSGRALSFTRGAGTSSLVQIDHVVALADAWQSGAQQELTATQQWLDLRLLAALGQPAYWSRDDKGGLMQDDGASRFDMQPRNQGSEIVGSRLRKLAESVSARKPPDVLAGLRGTLVRDEIGRDQVTSRTGTGFCNPGPVDNAVAWCALWGISQLPSTPRVGRRAVTISSGHLGRPRQEWFYLPYWEQPWRPARLRTIVSSGRLGSAARIGDI